MDFKKTPQMNNMTSSELENLMNIVNTNTSFNEATKLIRSKSNDGLSKAIKSLKDKQSVWPELIMVRKYYLKKK